MASLFLGPAERTDQGARRLGPRRNCARTEAVGLARAEAVELARAEAVELARAEAVELARAEAVELARARGAIWGHWRALCVQKGYN